LIYLSEAEAGELAATLSRNLGRTSYVGHSLVTPDGKIVSIGVSRIGVTQDTHDWRERAIKAEIDSERARCDAIAWEMAMRGIDAYLRDRANEHGTTFASDGAEVSLGYIRRVTEDARQVAAARRARLEEPAV